MWYQLPEAEGFYLKPSGMGWVRPEVSFENDDGEKCHIVREENGFSCMKTVSEDVKEERSFIRHERLDLWPTEVFHRYLDHVRAPGLDATSMFVAQKEEDSAELNDYAEIREIIGVDQCPVSAVRRLKYIESLYNEGKRR